LNANHVNLRNFYEGKDGACRLARDIGAGLNDILRQGESLKSIKSTVSGTYSVICVIFYNLNPPVDAKEWSKQIWSKINAECKG
jgi:hypothetical protein